MELYQRTGQAYGMELGYEGNAADEEEHDTTAASELSALARGALDARHALGRTMGVCESRVELRLGPLGGLGKILGLFCYQRVKC